MRRTGLRDEEVAGWFCAQVVLATSSILNPRSIRYSEVPMPLPVPFATPTIVIRRSAFERAGLTREAIDKRLNLTADEFRVEGGLIAIGPIHGDEELTTFVEELERVGLVYFDDFFDLSGSWPEWLEIFVMAGES
jgi:hypothetical protein